MKKKLLAILLTVAMAMSLLPMAALATEVADGLAGDETSTERTVVEVKNQTELNAAITAANGPTTINLAAGNYTILVKNSDNPNMDDKDITFCGGKDAVMDLTGIVGATWHTQDTGATITFDGVTVKWNEDNEGYQGFANAEKVVYKNCTIYGTQFMGGDADFINCVFEAEKTSEKGYAVYGRGAGTLTFTDCNFKTDGRAIMLFQDQTTDIDVVLTNCTFSDNGNYTGKDKAVVETGDGQYKTSTFDITINNCTYTGFEANNSTSPLWGNKDSIGGDRLNVTIDGNVVYPLQVAKVGETVYSTLDEAFDAAMGIQTAGNAPTIEILNDVTVDEWIQVEGPSGWTINGNNKTITVKTAQIHNGEYLFHNATNLNISDLNVVFETNGNGVYINSGKLDNVKLTGGEGSINGVVVGYSEGAVVIENCEINGFDFAVYGQNEGHSANITVKNSKITNCGSVLMSYSEETIFTGNTVTAADSDSELSLAGAIGKGNDSEKVIYTITDNTLNDAGKIYFYGADLSKVEFEKNKVSGTSHVTTAEAASGELNLTKNYWGGSAPSATQVVDTNAEDDIKVTTEPYFKADTMRDPEDLSNYVAPSRPSGGSSSKPTTPAPSTPVVNPNSPTVDSNTTTNTDGSTTVTENKQDGTKVETTTGTDGTKTETASKTETVETATGTTTTTKTETKVETPAGDKVTSESVEKVEAKKDGTTATTTTTETKTEAQDGTTKTETTVVETLKDADGTETTTAKTETKLDNGSTGTTTVAADGTVKAEVTVTAAAVDKAAETSAPVALPMPAVTASADTTVSVSLPTGTSSAKVEVPVADVNPGVVAVIVNADGTEEIVKTTAVTEEGVALPVTGDVTLKLVDNSKDFDDVAETDWSDDAVTFVSAREIMNGTSTTTFQPAQELDRGMMAQVLHNLENNPQAAAEGNAFTDVADSAWFHESVTWAAETGILTGYGDGTYGPGDNITREQLATILFRYAQNKGYDVTGAGDLSDFRDGASTSEWASQAMAWAIASGIMNGKGDGVLDPTGDATRAEVATMVMKFCQNVAQ